MAIIKNYGVGTSCSAGITSGAKSSFSQTEKIYAGHKWTGISGGDTLTISWQKKINNNYVEQFKQTTNPAEASWDLMWQCAWMKDYPVGKWRAQFSRNENVMRNVNFEIISVAPPPTPPTPPVPPEEAISQIVGQVTDIDTKLPLINAIITFGSDTRFSAINGWYGIIDPDKISGPIKCELSTYKTLEQVITAPLKGVMQVDFQMKSLIPTPPPEVPEETIEFWINKGYTNEEAELIAAWVRANKMTPTQDKIEEIIAPLKPEITWWEKLLGLLISSPFLGLLTSKDLFKSGYLLLTGKEISDAEYELKRLQLADWVLPINLLLKLFEGRNLKGEAEEFGSASDWLESGIYLVGAIIPGQVDETAAKFGLKTITKTQADDLVVKLGKPATIDLLRTSVLKYPESSAKFLAKFPQSVREAVISGLYKTAAGRIAVVTLSKAGYFKYLAPWWKNALVKAGIATGVAGLLVGAIGSYPFAGFIKEEALQTLGFAVLAAIKNKDAERLRTALDEQAQILDITTWEKLLGLIPYANVVAQLRDFYNAAKTKLDIDEAGFEDMKAEWEEEAKPKGTLTVYSNVEKSDVYINGIKKGITPYEIILDEGTYHILVTKFGYDSTEIDVDIVGGATPKFNAEILPLAPPPTGKGTLDISVEPTDANLIIAGHPEITKMGAYELDLGTYTIKASKENYYDKSATAIVKEAEITDVSIVLTELPPKEALINLTSEPEGAKIYIDNKYIFETTPETFKVDPGHRKMTLKLNDYEDFIHEFDIEAGETQDHHHILTLIIPEEVPPEEVPEVPKKATITITSDPTNADVYIDGEYKWTTTPYTILFNEGSYIVRLQKDGYYPVEIEIEVEAGEVAELPFVLEAIPTPVIPVEPYIPQTPYYPTYVPPTPYVPAYVPTPPAEVPPYNYSNLYPPAFSIAEPQPYSKPLEKELLINIETTSVKPWEGRIYSIAYLDLTDPTAEIKVLTSDNEEELIRMFIDWFDVGNYSKLVGFKLIFDYRFIFAKMMLYRITNKKFYDIALRDVKQILDQVKEEFVYFPSKIGTLDDWGKMLLGRGKYGAQELMLRKYISGDFEYVQNFQIRQIELTRDLYNLTRFSMGEAFISSPTPVSTEISPILAPESVETPGIQGKKTCPICKAYNPLSASVCEICGAAI